jgi:hypothetical protein
MRRLIFALATLGSMPALAQAPAQTPLSALYACQGKPDAERLACFDAAVAALQGRESRQEVVAIDEAAARTLRREAFGFNIPSLPRLGLAGLGRRPAAPDASGAPAPIAAEEADPDDVVLSVAGLGADAAGRPLLRMTEGQVWVLIDSSGFRPPSARPFNVRIREAMMGSFLLQIEGRNRGFRARRVE